MVENDLNNRRILLTTRYRFSPHIQPIKEKAFDIIICQIIFLNTNADGISEEDISNYSTQDSLFYSMSVEEIYSSIKRLIRENKILKTTIDGATLYKLTKRNKNNLQDIEKRANLNFNNVLVKLFSKNEFEKYHKPFLEVLSYLFSELGEENVKLIRGEIEQDRFSHSSFISDALKIIKKEYKNIDFKLLEEKVICFFQEDDPEYNSIKWNMAQNYYIAKTLGYDSSDSMLSEDVFENSKFYLDTNILISALEPNDRNHSAFKVLSNACNRLNIELIIFNITIDELNNWLDSQYSLLKDIIPFIPTEMSNKINSALYRSYCVLRKKNNDCSIEDVFKNFINPERKLFKEFKAKVLDEKWFDSNRNKKEIIGLANKLRKRFSNMRRYPKKMNAAIHDALAVSYIIQKKDNNNKNWFITLDSTLPGAYSTDNKKKEVAVTLCAILQWIAPFGIKENELKSFSSIFTELIKLRLLPRERFFDIKDFKIFECINMDCTRLPSKDVEECIKHLRKNLPHLNPLDPSDREKLFYEVNKFFMDDAREFKEIKNKLTGQLSEERKLKENISDTFEDYKKKVIKSSAINRIWITIIIFLIIEVSAFYYIIKFGNGVNIHERILNYFWIPLALLPSLPIIGILLLGKDRIKALGWKIIKLFKIE